MRPQLILVANRLPFTIQEGSDGLLYQPSPGGMAAALGPVRDYYDAQWIGWAGLDRPLLSAEHATLTLPPFAHVVDIPTGLYHDYYFTVANGTAWPLLHGMQPRSVYEAKAWKSSLAVNKQFAARTMHTARAEDVIWVHDFHLFMVPHFLRKIGSKNRIGFFLHIPVAAPEVLAQMPHWPNVLKSLAQTDLCGVQTERDAINLHASFIAHGITPPRIKAFPIGIHYQLFADTTTHPTVTAHTRRINTAMEGKTVILSVSRLDYTKGILQQLQAVDALLQQTKKDVLYKLIVAPSREALTEYAELKNAIDAQITTMQLRHPGKIDYDYRSVGLHELAAWYKRADIMLVTPLIDGMNLVAKEYIAARKTGGLLILSSQAGAATQLKDALIVDPTQLRQITKALNTATTMSARQRNERHSLLLQNVIQQDVFAWANSFLAELAFAPASAAMRQAFRR